ARDGEGIHALHGEGRDQRPGGRGHRPRENEPLAMTIVPAATSEGAAGGAMRVAAETYPFARTGHSESAKPAQSRSIRDRGLQEGSAGSGHSRSRIRETRS